MKVDRIWQVPASKTGKRPKTPVANTVYSPPPPESPDDIGAAARTRLARDRDLLWRVLVPLKGPRSLLGFVGRVAFGVACFLYFYRFPSAMDPSQPAQGPQPQPDANDVFPKPSWANQ